MIKARTQMTIPENSLSSDAHPELILSNKLIYEPCKLIFNSELVQEKESLEYGACHFSLNNNKIAFRVAKTTPTKIGQFVTLWKRTNQGPIAPYDTSDSVDLFVIFMREKEKFGQFVFPVNVLISKNIVSVNKKGGKRAIRLYAPWVHTTSVQAAKTRNWQIKYFIDLSESRINFEHVNKLYTEYKFLEPI